MLYTGGACNKMTNAADPYFWYLDVWLPAFATFLTVRRLLKVITKTYIYDQHIQKIPKIKQEFNQVLLHVHQFCPHTTSVVTLHFVIIQMTQHPLHQNFSIKISSPELLKTKVLCEWSFHDTCLQVLKCIQSFITSTNAQ